MKVGDLVKVWWYSKESIGIVVGVKGRTTVTVLAERAGQTIVFPYNRQHVLRIST